MTNQTIDGVPRKLLTSLLAWLERANERNGDGDIAEYVELRALLDADKVNNRQMGLVQFVEAHPIKPAAQPQGVQVAILSGPDDSVCWTQDNTPKELRKQVVLIEYADFLRLQYLASGAVEPIYQTRWNRLGEWEEWKTVSCEQYQRSEGRLFERRIVYAEQPAPVSVVLPERKPEPSCMTAIEDDREASIWNACLDEAARLTATVRIPEPLVMTDGLHTYEYVTGHNAAIDNMLGVKP